MIRELLIANRGEIALRVARACRQLGIKSVAVFSDVDAQSLHVKYCDEAYPLGPAPPADSYLNIDRLIAVARESGVDAVHPGYGFLAENSAFASRCEKEGLLFVGPSAATLTLTEDKLGCRQRLREAGVPILPGSRSVAKTPSEALVLAAEIGWPVLIKSVFGGGGRGIRIAGNREELEEAFKVVRLEAKLAFGRFGVYLERFIAPARHVEFQILADRRGHIIHLGERECSIQRRYQKLLEICPSPIMTPALRRKMGEVAVQAAQAVRYINAGTIEFIVDKDLNFHFIEVNARLQVEHPITEMVTGVDLVKQQLLIAGGDDLALTEEEVSMRGASLECRINAEDPFNQFAPSAGEVTEFMPPSGPGVRLDTALYRGWTVPIHYDSLVAKLVTWGVSFEEARRRMKVALQETMIGPIRTTIPFHQVLIEDADFRRGHLSTDFIERRRIMERLLAEGRVELGEEAAIAAALHASLSTPKGQVLAVQAEAKKPSWVSQAETSSPRGRFVDPL